tara:strand:+ start:1991 stop:2752 length:762 start_codon:yes stop_codon:yes gene_type:complete
MSEISKYKYNAFFVSDVHLCDGKPKTYEAFLKFLKIKAFFSKKLYLLGDIFEYWAGDDDINSSFQKKVINNLKKISKSGTKIFWLSGNRDFLVGEEFAKKCGFTIITEPYIASISNKKVLLFHGDAQCIDDTEYIKFRTKVRNQNWQKSFLNQSLSERKSLISKMRSQSKKAKTLKEKHTMDVNQNAINDLFLNHNVNIMIHGHTHLPGLHITKNKFRYVLSDWNCESNIQIGGWIHIDMLGEIIQEKITSII